MNPFDDALDQITPGDQKPRSIFDEAFDNVRARDEGRVRQELQAAPKPEVRAEALRLSKFYQAPLNHVERNLEEYRQRFAKRQNPYDNLRANQAPGVVSWMEQRPEVAPVVSDDFEPLASIERSLTFGQRLLMAARGLMDPAGTSEQLATAMGLRDPLKRGGLQVASSVARTAQWAGESVGAPRLARDAGQVAEGLEQEYATTGHKLTSVDAMESPQNAVRFLVESLVELVPVMAPMFAGGAAGSALLRGRTVLGFAGETVGQVLGAMPASEVLGIGEVQSSLKQKDPNATAPGYVFLGGSAIAALDSLPIGHMGSTLVRWFGKEGAEKAARKLLLQPVKPRLFVGSLKEGAVDMSFEGVTEMVQEVIGDVAAAYGSNTPVNWVQLLEQVREAGVVGALAGGSFGAGGRALAQPRLMQEYEAAMQQQAVWDSLHKGVSESKMAQLLPEEFRDALSAIGKVKDVFVGTKAWREHWQAQGVSPEVMAAELTGNADALELAERTGSKLAIPTGAYAAKLAATEHAAFFAQELSLDADMPSPREAAEHIQTVSSAMERLVELAKEATVAEAKADAAPAPPVAPTPLSNAVKAQLLDDPLFIEMTLREGLDAEAVADRYALLAPKVFEVLGQDLGKDPIALVDDVGLVFADASVPVAVQAMRDSGVGADPYAGLTLEQIGLMVEDPATPQEQLPAIERALLRRVRSNLAGGPLASATDTEVAKALSDPATAQEAAQELRRRAGSTTFFQAGPNDPSAGIERLAPFLTKKKHNRRTAASIMEVFKELAGDAEVADIALAGQAKKGWYASAHRALLKVFGPVDVVRVAALIAALSPRVSVQSNLRNAMAIWLEWNRRGRPRDTKTIHGLVAQYAVGAVSPDGSGGGMFSSWAPNVVRALQTENADQIKLSGPKVDPFMNNLLGYVQAVTTDAWMGIYFGRPWAIGGGGPTTAEHEAIAAKVRRVAKRLTKETGETWTPDNVQETVWSWSKTAYELASKDANVEELVRAGAVKGSLIAEAPDFATLMSKDPSIRELMENAGYGEVLRAFDEDPGPAPSPAVLGARVTPLTLRSARRIDDVRRRRRAIKRLDYEGLVPKTEFPAPDKDGGFTVNVMTGKKPTSGFSVALHPDRTRKVPLKDLDAKALANYVAANVDLLTGRTKKFFGAWRSRKEPDLVYLDVSAVFADREEALAAGFAQDEQAIYDHKAGEEVPIEYPPGHVHGPNWPERLGGPGAIVGEDGIPRPPAGDAERGAIVGTVLPADRQEGDAGGDGRGQENIGGRTAVVVTSAGNVRRAGPRRRDVVAAPQATARRPHTPNLELQRIVALYSQQRGFTSSEYPYVNNDEGLQRRIARAYDALPVDDSASSTTRVAYEAFSREVQEQWDMLLEAGYVMEPWTGKGQPYANSAEMVADVRDNKHIYFFTGGEPHPFLGESTLDESGLTINEKFRAVHDIIGHAAGGYAFGARGEENAWRAHASTFSDDARRAMTTETRGQNSWVNYGQHNYAEDGSYRNVPLAERPYATQKVAVLPDEFVFFDDEAVNDDSVTFFQTDPPTTQSWAYSRLEAAVEAAKTSRATGLDWKAIIKSSKQGINTQEFLLADVDGLEDGTKYTRDEVLEYLRANRARVEMFVMGDNLPPRAEVEKLADALMEQAAVDEFEQIVDRHGGLEYERLSVEEVPDDDADGGVAYAAIGSFGREQERWDTLEEAEAAVEEMNLEAERQAESELLLAIRSGLSYREFEQEAEDQLYGKKRNPDLETKFYEETLDENDTAIEGSYREVFLTFSNGSFEPARLGFAALDAKENSLLSTDPAIAELTKLRQIDPREWNYLPKAHDVIRKRIEELKQMRVSLFASHPGTAGEKVIIRAIDAWEKVRESGDLTYTRVGWRDGHDAYDHISNPIVRLRYNTRQTIDGKLVMFLEEVQPPKKNQQVRMPKLLLQNWREMAFKWALRQAAEQNLDGVAWTTGQQQSDRYSLETVIKTIGWHDSGASHRAITLIPHDREEIELYVTRDGVVEQTNDEELGLEGESLSDVIGEDLAAEIMATGSGKKTTEDLKVGGEGLRRLYDNDFPVVVSKLPSVKKSGVKVGTVRIKRKGQGVSSEQPFVPVTPELKAAVLAGQALFQGEEGGPRASITFKENEARIRFTKRANLTSLLHEFGHLYFQVLQNVVDKFPMDPGSWTPGQRRVAKTLSALLEFVGVGDASEVRAPQHELLARAMEAYFMRGVAPVPKMQGAFDEYRGWLMQAYKSMEPLGVKLSPEVIEAFDRMMATDEELADAAAEAGTQPIFATAEQAGMNPTQFEAYREQARRAHERQKTHLIRAVMADLQRSKSQEWVARRRELVRLVTAEMRERPDQRARLWLQRGQLPDGSPAPFEAKLSKDSIVEKYGAERLASLPRPYVYSVEGGIDVDEAARAVGFSNGDALLTALTNSERLEDVVEAEVDARMKREFGDMMSDGGLKAAAEATVVDFGHEEMLQAELKAIAKLAREAKPVVAAAVAQAEAEDDSARRAMRRALKDANLSPQALRAEAREVIAAMPMSEVKPNQFRTTAAYQASRAREALIARRFEDAVEAKSAQRLATALYQEALAAQRDSDRLLKLAKRLVKLPAQQRLGKAGASYQDNVNAILGTFEFAERTQRSLAKRVKLREWVAEREAEGRIVDLPADVLDTMRAVNYREATAEQLRAALEALTSIWRLANTKRRLMTSADKRAFEDLKESFLESISTHVKSKPTRKVVFTEKDQKRAVFGDFFASHARLATLAQFLDGFEDGGMAITHLVRPLNEAADAEAIRREKVAKEMSALLSKHYPGRDISKWRKTVDIPLLGEALPFEAVLAVALNWGNETSRQRLRDDQKRGWSEHQIAAILDTLDANDWAFVQAAWDYVNTFWPEISDKSFRTSGVRPEKVEAAEVHTKFGTLKGGYWPIVYESRLAFQATMFESIEEANQAKFGAAMRGTTRRGHEKARREHVNMPLRLEVMSTFTRHIDQVVRDLTHHEVLIDVTRLLRDREIASAMTDALGQAGFDQFRHAVNAIASGPVGPEHSVDRAATFARVGAQMAGLGLNLWSGVQQPLGIFNGAARVGPLWVARGMTKWLTSAKQMEGTIAWIHDVSPFMRMRGQSQSQDLADLSKAIAQPGSSFDRIVREVTNNQASTESFRAFFLAHIGIMQRVADVPTWLGQFEKSMASGKSEVDAIAEADQAVKDSQGGGQLVDLSRMQRLRPVLRLFMVFYSYGNTVYNQTARAAGQFKGSKSPFRAAEFALNLSLIYALPAFFTVMLGRLLRGSGDDDDTPLDVAADVAREMGSSAMNTMLLVREAAGLMREGNRGYDGPAGLRLVNEIFKLAEQGSQLEFDPAFWKALNSVGGILFRYPAGQVQRTVDGVIALYEGDTTNPLALLFGPERKK